MMQVSAALSILGIHYIFDNIQYNAKQSFILQFTTDFSWEIPENIFFNQDEYASTESRRNYLCNKFTNKL